MKYQARSWVLHGRHKPRPAEAQAQQKTSPAMLSRAATLYDSSTDCMDGFRVDDVSITELLAMAAVMTAREVERLVPPRNGYPSWLAPFRGYALVRGLYPHEPQQALLRAAANLCRWGVRLPPAYLAELEAIVGRVERADVEALFADDPWMMNFVVNVFERSRQVEAPTSYPWNISLPIADLCNARCIFCTSWFEGKAMIAPEQIEAFGEVISKAVYVGLVGHGEPLAHPAFGEIGETIAGLIDPRAGCYTITNGVHLARWTPLLQKMRLNSVSVSLNAATAETHDLVMGLGAGAFDRVIQGIKDLIDGSRASGGAPVDVSITMVVTQQNIHEVGAFIELGEALGVSSVWLRSLLPQRDLVEGLNYHTLSPALHPDYGALLADARAAIGRARIAVQAEPDDWGRPILPPGVLDQISRSPPRLVERAETLRNKALRSKSQAIYDRAATASRGRLLTSEEQTHIDWLSDGAHIRCANKPWSFALATPLALDPRWDGPVVLTAKVSDIKGSVSIGLWGGEARGWIAREILNPGDSGEIGLILPAGVADVSLVVDNASQDGVASEVRVRSPRLGPAAGDQTGGAQVDLRLGVVHNGVDPLEDNIRSAGRMAPFKCRAPYYNLYINEMFLRMTPCCYMTNTPGYEDIRFDGSIPFMAAWNSPAMVELRSRLRDGPLFGACGKCPETW
jgi:hypothetical protein